MGGRGASSGGGGSGGKVDLGFGVSASKSTVNQRIKVNEALGLSGGRSLAEWGVRKDILSGKSESKIKLEDKKRLEKAKKKSKQSSKSESKPKRHITSSTYERAQKRLQNDVANWYFGKNK